MIDLHTHILPGVDDGAPDLETAVAMGRQGVQQGLTKVAATPHFYLLPDWALVKEKVRALQGEFEKEQIDLELVCGAELMIDVQILEQDVKEIPTYGDRGKFCLIELPMYQVPIYTEQVFFVLQTKGIVPIIAHPERYGAVMENPNLILDWLNLGCLVQINSGSILGRFGAKIKETATIMLTHNMVQIVASDAHGLGSRGLNLGETRDALVKIAGRELTDDLLKTNPLSILEGTFSLAEKPRKFSGRRRFFFF